MKEKWKEIVMNRKSDKIENILGLYLVKYSQQTKAWEKIREIEEYADNCWNKFCEGVKKIIVGKGAKLRLSTQEQQEIARRWDEVCGDALDKFGVAANDIIYDICLEKCIDRCAYFLCMWLPQEREVIRTYDNGLFEYDISEEYCEVDYVEYVQDVEDYLRYDYDEEKLINLFVEWLCYMNIEKPPQEKKFSLKDLFSSHFCLLLFTGIAIWFVAYGCVMFYNIEKNRLWLEEANKKIEIPGIEQSVDQRPKEKIELEKLPDLEEWHDSLEYKTLLYDLKNGDINDLLYDKLAATGVWGELDRYMMVVESGAENKGMFLAFVDYYLWNSPELKRIKGKSTETRVIDAVNAALRAMYFDLKDGKISFGMYLFDHEDWKVGDIHCGGLEYSIEDFDSPDEIFDWLSGEVYDIIADELGYRDYDLNNNGVVKRLLGSDYELNKYDLPRDSKRWKKQYWKYVDMFKESGNTLFFFDS